MDTLSALLTIWGVNPPITRFLPPKSINAEFWYLPRRYIEETDGEKAVMSVIWDAIRLMRRHCNEWLNLQIHVYIFHSLARVNFECGITDCRLFWTMSVAQQKMCFKLCFESYRHIWLQSVLSLLFRMVMEHKTGLIIIKI